MVRRLALLTVVVVLAIPATAAAQPPLRWRTGAYHAYRVLLPSTWRVRTASTVGDHVTYFWYDPTNPLRKMLVTISACVGCVETNFDPHRPNPKGELPEYTSGLYWISPWKLAFSAYTTDDPYPENGLVIVLSRNGNVAGSAITQLWLPQSQHRLATQILNSFSAHV